MKIQLTQATPNAVETIAKIASICYSSDPKNSIALIKKLYESGHHSVFEHIYFTFKLEGISRACSHQLVRHRHCSFTQRSQRYCDEGGFDFVTPSSLQENTEYSCYMKQVNKQYQALQSIGVPNEDSRMVLPNACTTEMYLSCNLRELMHICNERLCSRAQWEIRKATQEMRKQVDPRLHFMLVPKCKSPVFKCNSPCGKEVPYDDYH